LNPEEAEMLSKELRQMESYHDADEKATTTFLADFDLALTQPEEAVAHTLAEQFANLGLSGDVTHGDNAAPGDGEH
jgi:hypothetical protein